MNGGKQPQGYTIIEVMIFLGVSTALFVSGSLLLSGQQGRTEFSQAIRETNSQIQDIINDTATGYYPNADNISCTAGGGSQPIVSSVAIGTKEQGTNEGCIFLGRVIHLAVHGTDDQGMNVYTAVANRQTLTDKEVSNYAEAQPRLIDATTNSDKRTLPFGLKVKKMKYVDGAGPMIDIGAVGFFSSFGDYGGGADLVSGAQSSVDLVPIVSTNLNQDESAIEGAVTPANLSDKNPSGGVTICFESGSTAQYGIITIGGDGRQTSSTLNIVDKSPMPAECA